MTPEAFFQGRLRGWGVARDPFGRILRRFAIEMTGEWSDEHRALHLDETYSYIGGETFQRRWAIHTDEQGYIFGVDAMETARMRGRQIGNDFQITFDRPRRPGGRLRDAVQVVRFIEVTPNDSLMIGQALWMGLPIASVHAALQRVR